MKTNELTPNPANPRTISDEQLERLRLSMKEFGDLSGVVRNQSTGNLVGGHQRVKILADAEITVERKFKKPTKQGTVAEGFIEHEGERYVYREVKWNKEKETAAMIAANKQGGEWELPMLKEILSELDTGNFDMGLTGFSADELEELMTAAPPEGENPNTTTTPTVIYRKTRDEKPEIAECIDDEKTTALIGLIKAQNLPKAEAAFLIAAARRHTKFHFENIAEYYAHSSKEVQRLMEESALVIVDFNKAIEHGFATMTDSIKALIGEEVTE